MKIGGKSINIVSFGGGTNSAALLAGLHKHNIPVDLILFADTGGEQPHTYQFIRTMDEWLTAHGMPQITVVEKYDRHGDRLTLEMECLNPAPSRLSPMATSGVPKSTRSGRRRNFAIIIRLAGRYGRRGGKLFALSAMMPEK